MTLIISIEAANWIQLQSFREDRTQLSLDEVYSEYLQRSRCGRQHDPVLNRSCKKGAHRSLVCREGRASKELDKDLELEDVQDLDQA